MWTSATGIVDTNDEAIDNGGSSNDLIIDDGFPALSTFRLPTTIEEPPLSKKDIATTKTSDTVSADDEKAGAKESALIPRYSFASFPSMFKNSNGNSNSEAIKMLVEDCGLAFTARSKEESDAYSSGSTFFVPSVMKPRCKLEALALDIFHTHTSHLTPGKHYNPAQSGAEWWTLLLESNHQDYDDESDDDDDDDGSEQEEDEVGMHFDADYGLEEQMEGYMIHPRLATVTYFSNVGVPTLVLDQKSPPPTDMKRDTLNGNIQKGWLSYPQFGKHIAFDGRLLHGAPGTFFPPFNSIPPTSSTEDENSEAETKRRKLEDGNSVAVANSITSNTITGKSEEKRVTFMVNIWLNHCPIDAEIMEDELCVKMKTPFDTKMSAVVKENENNKIEVSKKRGNLKRGDDEEDILSSLEWKRESKVGDELETKELMTSPDESLCAGEEVHVMCNHEVTMTFRSPKETLHKVAKQVAELESKSAAIIFKENALSLKVGKEVVDEEE